MDEVHSGSFDFDHLHHRDCLYCDERQKKNASVQSFDRMTKTSTSFEIHDPRAREQQKLKDWSL